MFFRAGLYHVAEPSKHIDCMLMGSDVEQARKLGQHPVIICVLSRLNHPVENAEITVRGLTEKDWDVSIRLHHLAIDHGLGDAPGEFSVTVTLPSRCADLWNNWKQYAEERKGKNTIAAFTIEVRTDWLQHAVKLYRAQRMQWALRWGVCPHGWSRVGILRAGEFGTPANEVIHWLPFFFRGRPTYDERQEIIRALLEHSQHVPLVQHFTLEEWEWFFTVSLPVARSMKNSSCSCSESRHLLPRNKSDVLRQIPDANLITCAANTRLQDVASDPYGYLSESLRRWPVGTFFQHDAEVGYLMRQREDGRPKIISEELGIRLCGRLNTVLEGDWHPVYEEAFGPISHYTDVRSGRVFRRMKRNHLWWELVNPKSQ